MTVTALLFFACAAAAALIYRRLPVSLRLPWLLLVSAGFVATWSWKFIPVLAVFAWVNFAIGKKVDPANPRARAWNRAGIIFNILFLLLLKYNNFYIEEFSRLLQKLDILAPGSLLAILLPVGLSFLAVQSISYLLDVVNKRQKPDTDFLRFLVYIFYFPKLLSGPVERARFFLPRLDTTLPFDRAMAEHSIALVLTGLFRKLVFANPLFNLIPPAAFQTPGDYPGQHLVFWLLAYAFALYNDFAGYTAIVHGVSLWFGIELSPNFNLPYLSRNFTEFWTRWHISLSNWLRDYIFFPLSRRMMKQYPARNHVLNIVLPSLITLLVSGAWHGLSWNMLAWGALHGVYLVVERVWGLMCPEAPLDERPRWRQRLGTLLTFILAALAWLPFRMPLPAAWAYFKGMFAWTMPDLTSLAQTLSGAKLISDWSSFELPSPILLLVLAGEVGFDLLQNRGKSEEFVLRWRTWAQVLLVVVLLLVALLAFFSDTTAPFVYQAF